MQEELLRGIRMIILDTDGVLNDGKVYIDTRENRIKKFDIREAFAIRLAAREGILFAIIAEHVTEIMKKKAEDLGIEEVHQGENKLSIYEDIRARYGLLDEEIIYIGDDIVDIPVLLRAGTGIVVSNGAMEARAVADFVTENPGGGGAVREVIESVLKAKGRWREAVREYLEEMNPGFVYE